MELRTPRLRLEPTIPAHADGVWAATEVSVDELAPWLAWAVQPTIESTRAFTAGAADEWDRGAGWCFTMTHDGTVAGTISLHRHMPLIRAAELGYWLRSDLAGRGLMTEAASAVVEYGFAERGLHRIELHVAPDNVASVRVAEKLGFRREGLLRDGSRGSGGFHDVYVYGLLEDDPRPRFH